MAVERNPFEGMQESVALDELEVKVDKLVDDGEVEFEIEVEVFEKILDKFYEFEQYKFECMRKIVGLKTKFFS